MKTELRETVDIITENERGGEEMGVPKPMEDVWEIIFHNPVYSQVPPSAPAVSTETNF